MNEKKQLTNDDLNSVTTHQELLELIHQKDIKVDNVLDKIAYYQELQKLQIELVKFQKWVHNNKKRVCIIFEGRDAAGKGGTIRRFIEHLNPRSMRVMALGIPTEVEKGQWYFRRYIKHFPNPGEIVFCDRSWYNRAVVEPVMGFCTDLQYEKFIAQVPEFEHMLYEDGIIIIKFWLSISKEEQLKRFKSRLMNPLKRWKFSPVDQKGQEFWDTYTKYKDQMFTRTHTSYSPWIIVKTNDKRNAKLESMRYVLSLFDYDGKNKTTTNLFPDPNIVMRYYRSSNLTD
ncbi:MAG: polyphosphate kinase 2 [Flavobacteriaceae bacterium]|jgi:polyphosphate kinase 2|nr:polyphosphate kinase 2 [Flavobacteriaceae bacterium]